MFFLFLFLQTPQTPINAHDKVIATHDFRRHKKSKEHIIFHICMCSSN